MRYVPEPTNELTLEWIMRELYRISDAFSEEEYKPITGNYTVLRTDSILFCTGTITVTLPTYPAPFCVKIINAGTGTVTVSGSINGVSTTLLSPEDAIQVCSNGSEYRIT